MKKYTIQVLSKHIECFEDKGVEYVDVESLCRNLGAPEVELGRLGMMYLKGLLQKGEVDYRIVDWRGPTGVTKRIVIPLDQVSLYLADLATRYVGQVEIGKLREYRDKIPMALYAKRA